MEENKVKGDLLKRLKYIRQHVYLLFEEPNSSKFAKFICYLILSLILGSTVMIINDSLPMAEEDSYQTYNLYLDMGISIVFLIEILLRLFSSSAFGGETRAFFNDFSNILDILAVLPFFFELGLQGDSSLKKLKIIRAIRFTKIFRLFKLSRYLRGIVLLQDGLRRSIKPVLNYLIIIISFSICISAALYYIESESSTDDGDNNINSIPEAVWWSMATLTTVGYGDKIPQSIFGKMLAGGTAIIGVVLLSMPVSILGKSIGDVYNEQKEIDRTGTIKGKFKKLTQTEDSAELSKRLIDDLEFLKFRLEIMKENDKHIRELLDKSNEIYNDLNDDISSLYHIIHQEFDILDIKSASRTLGRMSFGKKIKFFARMQHSKRKLKVNTITLSERSLESSEILPKNDEIVANRNTKHLTLNPSLKNLFKIPTNKTLDDGYFTPRTMSKVIERDNGRNMTFSSLVQRSRQMTATATTTNTNVRRPNKNHSNFSNRSFDKNIRDLSDGKSEEDIVLQEMQKSTESVIDEPPHGCCADYYFFRRREQLLTTEEGHT